MSEALTRELSILLGPSGWIPGSDAEKWTRDWLDRYGEQPLGVARPKTTEEVSKIVVKCAEANVKLVPQGGNTGLVGGSVAHGPNQIIVSMERMNGIGTLSETSGAIEVEAGVVLGDLHQWLSDTGQIFPLHLGSKGSAQIGGLIATNAGGSHAFRFGMMQDLVLGIEVVLPDGSVFDGMRAVQKDNAGYQLRKLFCGSEGTLGIVTRTVLKLMPRPSQSSTALLAVESPAMALKLARALRAEIGEFLTALEFFSDCGLSFALKNIPDLKFPLQTRSQTYVLVEAQACSERVALQTIFEGILDSEMHHGVISDGVIASSEKQAKDIWRIREEQPEGQRLEGPQLKHDVSVPTDRVDEFLKLAEAKCQKILPDIRINPFGHLGDGNIHYNISPPLGGSDFFGRESEIRNELYQLATSMNGSFAAEHGLGIVKTNTADNLRGTPERQLMAVIKSCLDPSVLLNPNVVTNLQQQ